MIKGRGSQINPGNRFEKITVDFNSQADEIYDDEFFPEKKIQTVFLKDESKSIIVKNNSRDVDFTTSLNPYRGCEHGCVYCYARPYHEYLGFSSGIDFESKIMVKENAADLLEQAFRKKSYQPDVIVLSGTTDCYQPVEKKLKITRKILEVCLKYRNPVSVITKNALILRDLDILKKLAEINLTSVTISITSLNRELTGILEPRTSRPELRLKTIEELSKNNIPVSVNLAPVIPGLNDEEIPAILKKAAEKGASGAGHIMLRLPYANKDLFIDWLNKYYPARADKILGRIKSVRKGKLNSTEWGKRFTGEGEIADAINRLFYLSRDKYGLNKRHIPLTTEHFHREVSEQISLF